DGSGGVDVAMVVAVGDDGDGAWGAWFSVSGRSSGEKQFWTWPEKVTGDGGSWVVAGDGRRKTFPAVAAGKREREREVADAEEASTTQAERLQLEKHLGNFMFKSTERLKGSGTKPNTLVYNLQNEMRGKQLLSVSLLICLGKDDCVERIPSEKANPPPTNNRPVLPAALHARINQELHELHVISAFVDSCLESIKQLFNNFSNQPNETNINKPESDDEAVDTPLVSPFPHSDNDSDDKEVLNELSEYENAGTLCWERIINSFSWDSELLHLVLLV
ncbi:hypothetical protein Tco_0670739, partial [Tanacetum coccineum]